MLVKEYQIVLPVTVEEYQVAQLYSVAEASKNETGGGEGIEVVKNEPYKDFPLKDGQYSSGQYTYKIYHLASKVPGFVRMLFSKGALEVHEEAWNAYPYCRTVVTNPGYMGDSFKIMIETFHAPGAADNENAHNLSSEELANREVVKIDIAHDSVASSDYNPEHDPKTFKSKKTGRGPLSDPMWMTKVQPVMTCYKLVTVEFKWFGVQGKTEAFIHKTERRIFTKFHRELFCWMDGWHGLTLDDIRKLEDKTKEDLSKQIGEGQVRGVRGD